MASTYIYALLEPDTKEIRYIGKTIDPEKRLKSHINSANKVDKRYKKSYVKNWIYSLLLKNKNPEMIIIEEVNNKNWQSREKYWIKFYKDEGCKLTNLTLGGDGHDGSRCQFKYGKSSKYYRVHYSIECKRYDVQIRLPNSYKDVYVGGFKNEIEAAYFSDCISLYYFGQTPNKNNYPEDITQIIIPKSIEEVKEHIKNNKKKKDYLIYIDKHKNKKWTCHIKNTEKPFKLSFHTIEEAIKYAEEYFNNKNYNLEQIKENILSNLNKFRKIKNIREHKNGKKYSVEFSFKSKRYYLGRYITQEEAITAYQNKIQELQNNMI